MKKIFIIVTFCFSLSTMAQQEFMITHYMYNGLALNPAYAGVHEGVSTSLLLREQWVGVPGAPSTQLFSIHSPLDHRPSSLGAMIFRDKIGVTSEVGGYFSYAYRIPINSRMKLSFGLQASGHNYKADYGIDNGVGDQENLSNISELKWNFGTGLMLHTDRFYLGASVPQLLTRDLDVDDQDGQFARLIKHYYVTAGYAFDIGRNIILKPNFLLKAVENAPVQVDLNANALLMEKLWVGLSYRSLDSVDGLIGLQITPQFLASYSVDLTTTEIEVSSHEIMLNYIFHLPTKKIVTPRYF